MKKKNRIMEIAGLRHRSDLLLEEEDDAADLFGGGEDEEAEADEEDDADADADADEEEKAEDEEAPEKLSAKEVAELGPGEIDLELDTIMDDIFDKSQKAFDASLQAEALHKNAITSLMFENADYEKFDMDRFARETARYINNYESLLDVEGMLFNKAKTTLRNQFGDMGQAAVDAFEEHMARVHGIDLTDKFEEDIVQPTAAGAGGEGSV
tara:strand:- start:2909 stop:3541 length:633 start_codon:yes stop_codon:yes gene_type:complete